jgi:hypothetical protein
MCYTRALTAAERIAQLEAENVALRAEQSRRVPGEHRMWRDV